MNLDDFFVALTLAAKLNVFVPCNITQNIVNVLFQQVKQRQRKLNVFFVLDYFWPVF